MRFLVAELGITATLGFRCVGETLLLHHFEGAEEHPGKKGIGGPTMINLDVYWWKQVWWPGVTQTEVRQAGEDKMGEAHHRAGAVRIRIQTQQQGLRNWSQAEGVAVLLHPSSYITEGLCSPLRLMELVKNL